MAGRNNHAIADALRALASAIENQTDGCTECNGWGPEVRLVVSCHGIHDCTQLVKRRRVLDESQKAEDAACQNASPGKRKRKAIQTREKPYTAPPVQCGGQSSGQQAGGSQPASGACQKLGGSSSSAGGVLQQPLKRGGASITIAPSTPLRCAKCGRASHITRDCPDDEMTCFNCQDKGHLSRDCPRPRKKRRGSGSNNQCVGFDS